MELTFSLPPGAFATTVLDMLVDYRLGNAPVIQDDS
jgi:tRNA(Glu) U13 pseudouridine synthase TruD